MLWVNKHQPSKMSEEDATRIVGFHQNDAVAPVQLLIKEVDSTYSHAHDFVRKLKHYTGKSLHRSESLQALLDKHLDRLSHASKRVTDNNKMLKKYVGIGLKLKLIKSELKKPDVGKPANSDPFES